MSVRELVVLGTASQVPTRYRNHNGYLLLWDDEGLLFDPGEGTQRQMIYANVKASQVTKILITHFHGDHSLGFAGICQRLSLDRIDHPVSVFFPASGKVFYDRLRRATIYHATATLEPRPIDADGVVFEGPGFALHARELDHGVDTYGYRLQEPPRRKMIPAKLAAAGVRGPAIGQLQRQGFLEVDGVRIELADVSEPRPGHSVAFVMDTRVCDAAVELARDADLLVIESTYLSSEAQEAHDHGHLTAAEAAQIAVEAGARKLVLTHFSQRYRDTAAFVEEAGALHPDVVAVKDGQRVTVPRHKG